MPRHPYRREVRLREPSHLRTQTPMRTARHAWLEQKKELASIRRRLASGNSRDWLSSPRQCRFPRSIWQNSARRRKAPKRISTAPPASSKRVAILETMSSRPAAKGNLRRGDSLLAFRHQRCQRIPEPNYCPNLLPTPKVPPRRRAPWRRRISRRFRSHLMLTRSPAAAASMRFFPPPRAGHRLRWPKQPTTRWPPPIGSYPRCIRASRSRNLPHPDPQSLPARRVLAYPLLNRKWR